MLIIFILLLNAACRKEYSYEKGIAIVQRDSSRINPVITNSFPTCSACKPTDNLLISTWNFKIGNSYLCGTIDAAGTLGDKTTFTFFGPSACSIDTGLVMTVYLSTVLNTDIFNYTTSKAAFFYYDHFGTKDIFISQANAPFSVTVESFIYATRIITGSFKGTVFKPNGDMITLSEGKFKVKLK